MPKFAKSIIHLPKFNLFTVRQTQCAKKVSHSVCAKKPRQYFGKIYLGDHFINILSAHFSNKIFGAKISNPKHRFVIFGAKLLYEQCPRRMLMKLTPGCKLS